MSTTLIRRLLGRRPEREADAELAGYLEMLAEDYVERGMSPDEARRAAISAVGDLKPARSEMVATDTRQHRRDRFIAWLDTLRQDIRFAGRTFAREKNWTAVAVLTLALAIGPTSALFSIVNAVLLRPLPFPEPDHVVSVTISGGNAARPPLAMFDDWKARSRDFSALAAYGNGSTILQGTGDPQTIRGHKVTADYFAVFGAHPLRGRVFSPADLEAGPARTVVLSEQTWRTVFGGDSGVVGNKILLDQQPATVVGIMPASFAATTGARYWEPYRRRKLSGGSYANPYVEVIGRIAPGSSLTAARAELHSLAPAGSVVTPIVTSLHDRLSRDARSPLLKLFAAVGILILIGCANVANLLLFRGAKRQREFAMRAAVGASAWRLVRFLLCESVLLAFAGAALGLLLARATLWIFMKLKPPLIGGAAGISIDLDVVFFTLGLAVLTAVLFGVLPAMHCGRRDVSATLLTNAAWPAAPHRTRLRRALVVGQLAMALALLTTAGLLIQSFVKLASADAGFDPARIIVADLQLSPSRYGDGPALEHFFNGFATGVSTIPGVQSIALSDAVPLEGAGSSIGTTGVDGRPGPELYRSTVSLNFFGTIGVQLVDGRAFNRDDTDASEPVAILNETAARAVARAQGRDVLGQRVLLADDRVRIVGVVRDFLQRGLESAVPGVMYVPLAQDGGPTNATTVVLRAEGDLTAVIRSMRDVIRRVDPREPLPDIRTLEDRLEAARNPRRFTLALLTGFAILGVALAMIGLYGVMSYWVAERTKEIGVRAALGADSPRIIRHVLGEGMLLVAAGLVLGLLGSFAAVRLLQAMLFRVSAYDPLTFTAATALLVLAALIACALPARRAAALDPLESLRG